MADTIIEIIQRGQQGAGGAGVPIGGTTGQHLAKKSDTDYDTEWVDAAQGGGGNVEPVRGGVAPDAYEPTTNYAVDDRVSINSKEYRCITGTTGAFDITNWVEVSTQNNEERLAILEEQLVGTVINEYEFTQTTTNVWTVTNAGESQDAFNSATTEFFYNGVKLRKGSQVVWVDDTQIQIPMTSVINEDFVDIRVTTVTSVSGSPEESEYSQDVISGGVWTVSGIGGTKADFDSAKIQIYYNGVKLRKGTQVVWVSPTELQVNYLSVATEDYLTIRNEV